MMSELYIANDLNIRKSEAKRALDTWVPGFLTQVVLGNLNLFRALVLHKMLGLDEILGSFLFYLLLLLLYLLPPRQNL